jgi:hypothetical protein
VSVTLTNTDTGLTRTVVTDANGRFRVPLLPVGPYRLTAELGGFQTLQRDGLVLNVGALQSLGDLTIEVATVEEVITVTAESPLIETGRSVSAATFDSREIENLPIAGRDYKNFALNTPNVVTASPTSGRTTINLGGMKGIDTNITVDGADFNNTFFGSATGQPEVPYFVVSQEAVQEFQVLANGYSAEFGRSGGGFLNVVTKSGTNDIQGSGFFFGRNEELRSTLTDGTGKELTNAQFSQQQFGGSFGGPIVRDKAHYFFAVDRQGFDRPVAIRFNRNVTGVCNTQIYGQIVGGVDCLSDEEKDTAELLDNTAFLAKVDWQLSGSNTLSVRYNFSDFTGENFFSTAGGVAGTVQSAAENGTNLEANTAQSIVVNNTTLIGTNMFNELRFQYSFEERPRLGQSDDLPTIVINDTGRFGKQWFLPITSDHSRIQLTNNFTYLFGDHDMKMGVDLNLTDTSQAFYGWGGGYYAFTTLENYIAGRPNQFTQRLGLNGFTTPESGTIDIGQEELAFYIADAWRPSPGLTLNLGLRWEGQWNPTAPEQTNGKQSKNPANPGLDTIGLVQGDIPNDLNNLAPRFGFAWDPKNDGQTVVRGGAGVFYSRTNLLLMANSFTANGYRQALFFLFGSQIPPFPFVYPESGLPPDDPLNKSLPPSDIAFFDPDFNNPRTTRANIGVEREVFQDYSFAADYVIADTVNDHRRTNRNIPQPPIGFDAFGRGLYNPNSRVDPLYNQFQVEESTARRRYHAITLSARKRLSNRYQFQAFYTLSNLKTDDDNERDSSGFRNTQPENLDADWADSENDLRHRFVASAVVDIPGGFVFSTLLQTNTGRPFNVLSGRDDNGDRNTNDYAVITDANRGRAEAAGQDLADGLQPRSAARQPSGFLMDIRFSKLFDFGPGNLELLFEVFNLFNNANRLTTNPSIGSPNFGFLNVVGDPRQVQLGVRYRF